MNSGIYQIRNLVNDKSYIGSTKDFKQRKISHDSRLYRDVHHSPYLQNAYNKYGKENFVFEILFTCPESELLRLEQYHINNYNSEYNICKTAGSFKGTKFSEERKKQMSDRRKGQKNKFPRSDKGKKLSAIDVERRYKNVRKEVYKICPITLEIIGEYKSVEEARKTNNITGTSISKSAYNETLFGRGFIWSFTKDFNKKNLKDRIDNLKGDPYKVLIFSIDKKFVGTFNSSDEASDFLNCSKGSIQDAASGRSNSAKNHIIIYEKDYSENLLLDKIDSKLLADENSKRGRSYRHKNINNANIKI